MWLLAPQPAPAAPPPRVAPGHVFPDMFSGDRGLPPLETLGDGRLRHRGDGFTATIRSDGSVQFRDVVDRDYKLFGLDLRRRRIEAAPLDQRSPLTVDFEERAIFPEGRLPVIGGGGRMGGLADWTIGQRHVSAKRAFLDATAGLRFRLAYGWQRARTQEQLAALGDQLVALWRDPKLPADERRRRLFLLWDECAEHDPAPASPFDALRGAAGQIARSKIAAFVRMVAPADSPDAYLADELARLNAARRSVARFDPYRDDAPGPPELPEPPAPPERPPPRDDPEPEPAAYGPIPEPTVAVPEPPPEPARRAPKARREDTRPSVRIGPIKVPIGR